MGLSKNPLISGVATHKDLAGRMDTDSHPIEAITGLPEKVVEMGQKVSAADVLTRTNTQPYTPSGDYQPTTKKYVDDGRGVTAFNGRTGALIPMAGDYTPTMVGAAAAAHDHDSRYYTEAEVDNKIAAVTTSLEWKPSVANFAAIATTYPTPQDGWTVNVRDTDYTYRYTGSVWVVISANATPKATSSTDGLMSKEDKTKLDGMSGSGGGGVSRQILTATLVAGNWSGSSAPFTYSLSIVGILATDRPHFTVDYSSTQSVSLLEKTAFACIDEIDATETNTIVFHAFDTKPQQSLNIVIEVLR